MLIVVALGGNALLKRGEPMTAAMQRANVRVAAKSIAELIMTGHQIVITHGNGPQVGLLALQSAAGPTDGHYPLDILGAESEGMIGYLIEQELRELLPKGSLLATLLTQVRVDPADLAFLKPGKPIGPVYDEATAHRLAGERNWQIAPDGPKWRRVVGSPTPLEIMELGVIAMLVERGVIVICAGGGGIPVAARGDGSLAGIEAVIDKDAASSLLARQLGADMLLLMSQRSIRISASPQPAASSAPPLLILPAVHSRPAPWDPRSRRRWSSSAPLATPLPSAASRTPWRSCVAKPERGSWPTRRPQEPRRQFTFEHAN